jgi:lipid A ethanolaminephosphotransferase
MPIATSRAASFLREAWNRPRTTQAAAVAVAGWTALAGNLALWRAIAVAAPGARGVLVTVAVAAILWALTAALLSLVSWNRHLRWSWLAVVFLAAIAQHAMLAYGLVVDVGMVGNALQTDPHELGDLLTWSLALHLLLIVGPPALWLARVPFVAASPGRAAFRSARLFAASATVSALVAVAAFGTLAPLVRENMHLRFLPNPVAPIASMVRVAKKTLVAHRAGPSIRLGAALGPRHAPGARPPLVLLVLGETARGDRFVQNGYARPTTPETAALDGMVSWIDVRSCGTSTLESLPCMFSPGGRGAKGERPRGSESLLDVADAAGIAVLWVDNQSGCKGVCDRTPQASTADLAGTPAGRALCTTDECHDEALLEGLDARIAALPEAKRRNGVLVVLHQMGSHGPLYARRSPPAFKRFLPECETPELSRCTVEQVGNAYDNTIAYTDHVLAKAVAWLRTRADREDVSMLYVSDHGESLGELGIWLHGLPYAIAPSVQTRVPMLLWLGDAERRRVDAACLRASLGAPRSHDNLYPTVLGLLDVTSPTSRESLDLLAPCRVDGNRLASAQLGAAPPR